MTLYRVVRRSGFGLGNLFLENLNTSYEIMKALVFNQK